MESILNITNYLIIRYLCILKIFYEYYILIKNYYILFSRLVVYRRGIQTVRRKS